MNYKSHCFNAVFMCLTLLSVNADATTVYTYEGNGFENFSGSPSTHTSSMSISGYFEFSQTLSPGMQIGTNVTPTYFYITDGIYEFDTTNADLTNMQVQTNFAGGIIGWAFTADDVHDIIGATGAQLHSDFISVQGLTFGQDWSKYQECASLDVFAYCDSYVDHSIGQVTNNPGTWTRVIIPEVPLPAAVWLFGSGLLGLIGVARRKKA